MTVETSERERQDARFHELRAQGATYEFIADEFGISKQAIAARYSDHPAKRRAAGRCRSRVNHPPHVARWHNGVETLCDGQPKEQR